MRVILAGATGLVGGECLRRLRAVPDVTETVTLARRAFEPPPGAGTVRIEVVDFDRLDDYAGLFRADALICALGTTIKQAGSQDAFRKVDYDYPLALAHTAHGAGVSHYLLISALGADADSRVFYNRVKGEIERAVSAVPFPRVSIFRPSLLLVTRKQFRLGEEVGKRLAFLFPDRYKPIQAATVAAAVISALGRSDTGVRFYESREMRREFIRGSS
ncbi:MAG: hypothetical protein AB7I33_09950 [Gemmatimonadales bacterium]